MDRGAWVCSPRDFEESDMAERLSHRRDNVVLLGLPEWETSAFPCPTGPRGEAAPRGDCCLVRTERRWVSSENCLPGALRGWRQLPVTHQRGSQRNTYHDPSLLLPSDPLPELASERNQTGRQRTEHSHRPALKASAAGARLDLEGKPARSSFLVDAAPVSHGQRAGAAPHLSHGGKISVLQVGTGLTSNSRRGFPGGTAVRNLPATQEMQVRPLGGEDPPEKEMATHPSILAWEIPWSGDPGGATFHGVARLGHDLATTTSRDSHVLIQPAWLWNVNCLSQLQEIKGSRRAYDPIL